MNIHLLIILKKNVFSFHLDVQGRVVSDQKEKTSMSRNNGQLVRRKVLKIKDQTSTATVTIWSNKVIDTVTGEINT